MNQEGIAFRTTICDRSQGVHLQLVYGKCKVIFRSLVIQSKGTLDDTLGEMQGNGSAALQFASQPQEA